MASAENSSRERPVCKYGDSCYRKNPDHFKEYIHLSLSAASSNTEDSAGTSSISQKRKIGEKVNDESLVKKARRTEDKSDMCPVAQSNLAALCRKYGYYMSYVHKYINESYNAGSALTLHNVLNGTKDELVGLCLFSYMYDITWIRNQLKPENRNVPITLVTGAKGDELNDLRLECQEFPNIKVVVARLEIMFGVHHTKMILLHYKTGIRIMITTANLIPTDWFLKSQALWCSPLLPKGSDDSMTGFRKDLCEYLTSYKLNSLQHWINTIEQHDFRKIKVFLIASSPGRHTGDSMTKYGHPKLKKVLKDFTRAPDDRSSIIAQFSSVGKLGKTPDSWLTSELLNSLAASKNTTSYKTDVKLIFPTVENVRLSLEGYDAGCSLPFASATYQTQTYMKNYLHCWRSEARGRSSASPHIKSYMRLSGTGDISWFLMTSSNMSKAAWGVYEKSRSQFMIRSYELGVLYVPQIYNMEKFTYSSDFSGENVFPLPFDIPLSPYQTHDEPWLVDKAYRVPDRFNDTWRV